MLVKFADDKILHGERVIKIRDYWIAAIGDSFASGEGNPDVPANAHNGTSAKWLSSWFCFLVCIIGTKSGVSYSPKKCKVQASVWQK